jgi:V8-like Glu-specific endopeptidase
MGRLRLFVLVVIATVLGVCFAQPKQLPVLSAETNPELVDFAESVPVLAEDFIPVEVRGYLKGKAVPANLKKEPYIYAGRLKARTGNSTASCTAQLVAHQRMVLTAAHCVYDSEIGQWIDDLEFVRAYGDLNQKSYDWECVAVPTRWVTDHDYSGDYAWIKLKTDGPTYLGILFYEPYDDFMAIGYPINFGDTKVMHTVNGTLGSRSTSYGLAGMVANTMTNGSSGGAWLNYENQVIGLNSFTWSDRPNVMYSPLLTPEVMQIFQAVLDGTESNLLFRKCNN